MRAPATWRRPRARAAGALFAVLLAGCPRSQPPPPILDDAGPLPDVPLILPTVDTDGDGLCDGTEVAIGLDYGNGDTDGDGFADGIEYAIGSDGRRNDSPDPETVVYLTEAPEARVDTTLMFSVRGMGQAFTGAFTDVLGTFSDPERLASDYLADAHAVGATPSEAIVGVEGERFLGVHDRAILYVSLGFASTSLAEGCVRIFGFQYVMKDEIDGHLAGVRRGYLVVVPPDVTPGATTWCPIRTGCF